MPKLDQAPASVPVFNCIAYVQANESGQCSARVANLEGLQATAHNQREAIATIVAAFKERVSGLHSAGEPIPWIEPPAEKTDSETELFIPVHL